MTRDRDLWSRRQWLIENKEKEISALCFTETKRAVLAEKLCDCLSLPVEVAQLRDTLFNMGVLNESLVELKNRREGRLVLELREEDAVEPEVDR